MKRLSEMPATLWLILIFWVYLWISVLSAFFFTLITGGIGALHPADYIRVALVQMGILYAIRVARGSHHAKFKLGMVLWMYLAVPLIVISLPLVNYSTGGDDWGSWVQTVKNVSMLAEWIVCVVLLFLVHGKTIRKHVEPESMDALDALDQRLASDKKQNLS